MQLRARRDAGPSAGLIQCERTWCVAAGRWQCTTAHRLWRLVCHRQCCQSLTCVLEPQQAAAAACSSSLLLPHKSSQRRSEACRNRVVLSLLRLSAFKPIDRSWTVPRVSLRRGVLATCDDMGRAGARALWSKRREKGGSDDCHVPKCARRFSSYPPLRNPPTLIRSGSTSLPSV